MTEPTALTFESGYTRLKTIAEQVTSEDVPVAEMCDLFAEGKGLQTALTEYLEKQKGRVEAIERGEGIRAFRIVAPSATDQPAETHIPRASGSPSGAADASFAPAPARTTSVDDDIPF